VPTESITRETRNNHYSGIAESSTGYDNHRALMTAVLSVAASPPRGPGHPEPRKRPRSSYLRFAAELPNQCRQADFTCYPFADGTEVLTWLDDHSGTSPAP
jgi:hypothetical protein